MANNKFNQVRAVFAFLPRALIELLPNLPRASPATSLVPFVIGRRSSGWQKKIAINRCYNRRPRTRTTSSCVKEILQHFSLYLLLCLVTRHNIGGTSHMSMPSFCINYRKKRKKLSQSRGEEENEKKLTKRNLVKVFLSFNRLSIDTQQGEPSVSDVGLGGCASVAARAPESRSSVFFGTFPKKHRNSGLVVGGWMSVHRSSLELANVCKSWSHDVTPKHPAIKTLERTDSVSLIRCTAMQCSLVCSSVTKGEVCERWNFFIIRGEKFYNLARFAF